MAVGWRSLIPLWMPWGGGIPAAVATPDIHLHIDTEDFDADGTFTVTPQVGLGTINKTIIVHNHGDAMLIVASGVIANESNVTVAGTLTDGPLAAGGSVSSEFMLTPDGYGAWSFDITITSDDPTTPVLTVRFVGTAYGTQTDIGWTAPNRRLEWTAPNRRLEWTAV